MPDGDGDRPPSTRWLSKWLREEKFWQDITTRTLAALIVIFLGYVYAVLAGYVGAPNMWRVWVAGVVTVVVAALAFVYLRWAVHSWRQKVNGPFSMWKFWVLLTAPFALAVGQALVFGAYWLMQWAWR
jgi:hypothetical protein